MQKLFFYKQNRFQLFIACFGCVIGLIMLLVSIQLYIKAKLYNDDTALLDENTLIVQKQVGRAAHLGIGSPNFSQSEIAELKSQEFITTCSPIMSNQFEVIVEIDDPIIPAFKSNIFLQSVENEFIDISSTQFGWSDSSDYVPVVMPNNFLIMLNTFLSASAMPQLSESLISNVKMNLIVGPRSDRAIIPARIVGFTDTFSAILVPSTFLKMANLKYANTQNQFQSQLVVKAADKMLGLLESHLKDKGYESGEGQLFISRLKSALSVVLVLVICLALLTLLLSFIIMIQYLLSLLSNLSFEIRVMLRLGHSIYVLKNKFLRFFAFIFTIVSTVSIVSFYFMSSAIENKLISSGILINKTISVWSVVSLFVVFIIFILSVNFYTTRRIKAQFYC